MMFFMLFIMISPIRSNRFITRLLPRKDDDEFVTNSNDAVNNSWEKESCIRSLDNVKLVNTFMNICDNILIMFKEYQQHFKEGSMQPFSFLKKNLCNCKNLTTLNKRLAQNKLFQKIVIVIYKDNGLLCVEVRNELDSYLYSRRFPDKYIVVKRKNVRKSLSRYTNTHFNLACINYYVSDLFCFMYLLLSIEENPGRWLNNINANFYQFHTYFHELVFRLHEAFIHNKICPFDKDSLKKLSCMREQFEYEYEAENEYWSTHEISVGKYNLIISMSCLIEQFDSTNAPNNPYQHGNQAEDSYLVQSNDDSETRAGSRRSIYV